MLDRSSRPAFSPRQTPPGVGELIEVLRRGRKVDPVQLAGIMADEHGLLAPAPTIFGVLARRGITCLRDSTCPAPT